MHGASLGETKCLVDLFDELRKRPAFKTTEFVLTYTSLSARDWLAAGNGRTELITFELDLPRLRRRLTRSTSELRGCIIAEKDRRPDILFLHKPSCFVLNIEAKPPQSPQSRLFEQVLFGSLTRIGNYTVDVRAHEKARKSGPGSLGFLRPSGFLRALGVAEPVAVPFNGDNLGVVREAIDQRDGAGGVGKDRVPLLEG